jgi:hypothetical protein
VANVPVDYVSPLDAADAYVGRRRASVPAEPVGLTTLVEDHPKVELISEPVPEQVREQVREPVREVAPAIDTGTIERVLSELEPVDQTTSFAHEPTERLPLLPAEPPSRGGKRRAQRHAGRRGPLFKRLPSVPVLVGIAAMAVSALGVVTVNPGAPASGPGHPTVTNAASALGGASGQGSVSKRDAVVTRDNQRDAQADAADEKLQEAAEGMAAERNTELKQLAADAEGYAKVLAKNLWAYPLEPVLLTAHFGQYGLWSSYHTGLDFNGNTGDEIHSIANGG